MSSANKKSSAPRGIPQPFNRPTLRSTTTTAVQRKPPVAPPVYRPQPVPKVLQTKRSATQNIQAGQPLAGRPNHLPGPPRIVQPMMAARSVIQRMEEQTPQVFEESEVKSPKVDISRCCKYNAIKGEDPWGEKEGLIKHCITYCGSKEKTTWVRFAYVVGVPPPELGHGSELATGKGKGGGKKQGSAKDAKRWDDFQKSMTAIIALLYANKPGNTPYQKAEKVVKEYDGELPL